MTDRLLTRKEVEALTGLSRSTLYRMKKEGRFPQPRQMGSRAVRWPASEVELWVQERPRAGGAPTQGDTRGA